MFRYSEKLLAETLGVTQAAMEEARAFIDVDQWLFASRRPFYSEAGVRQLLERMEIVLAKKANEKKGGLTLQALLQKAEQPDPEETQARIFRVDGISKNGRVLNCSRDREKVRVLVRSAENFVAGMYLLAVPREEDLWDLLGRLPRFRGQW